MVRPEEVDMPILRSLAGRD